MPPLGTSGVLRRHALYQRKRSWLPSRGWGLLHPAAGPLAGIEVIVVRSNLCSDVFNFDMIADVRSGPRIWLSPRKTEGVQARSCWCHLSAPQGISISRKVPLVIDLRDLPRIKQLRGINKQGLAYPTGAVSEIGHQLSLWKSACFKHGGSEGLLGCLSLALGPVPHGHLVRMRASCTVASPLHVWAPHGPSWPSDPPPAPKHVHARVFAGSPARDGLTGPVWTGAGARSPRQLRERWKGRQLWMSCFISSLGSARGVRRVEAWYPALEQSLPMQAGLHMHRGDPAPRAARQRRWEAIKYIGGASTTQGMALAQLGMHGPSRCQGSHRHGRTPAPGHP